MDAPWCGKCDFEKFRAISPIDVKTIVKSYERRYLVTIGKKKKARRQYPRTENVRDIVAGACVANCIGLNSIFPRSFENWVNTVSFFFLEISSVVSRFWDASQKHVHARLRVNYLYGVLNFLARSVARTEKPISLSQPRSLLGLDIGSFVWRSREIKLEPKVCSLKQKICLYAKTLLE